MTNTTLEAFNTYKLLFTSGQAGACVVMNLYYNIVL